ncbi:cytochrome c [Flavimaricola marinus]|uniref:Fructose dehydrogenase cytochrome subunit n=1 Tax=Flavimaricola marinus TaxID=1819565 RepID=A0A238LCU3_9RHOB|nr:cytochrome c [Flavimaricola marinus]SMY07373.1 Fructose dehydrogenase cytochrome subunit precursor [Flavimaricola marinus]
MLRALTIVAVAGVAGAWFLTRPASLPDDTFAGMTGDPEAGALVFAAAGCASCHLAPEVTETAETVVLAGGRRFASDFGTFIAPNISSDPEAGIGAWSDLDIANAVIHGVSPEGAHYYPAFPYTTYANAAPQDVLDLIAYLRTLPADATPSQPHEVGFPFNIRRSLGGWKLLFADAGWTVDGDLSPEAERGRYLAEALGHCAECHTPRNALGGLDRSRWLAGAPNPSGEGNIPNITPAELTWSETEIAEYLNSGFTPEFDTAGGEMVDVIGNTSQLPASDRTAIAAYLKAVPPIE